MTATKEPNQRPNQPQQDEVWAFCHFNTRRIGSAVWTRRFGGRAVNLSSRFCSMVLVKGSAGMTRFGWGRVRSGVLSFRGTEPEDLRSPGPPLRTEPAVFWFRLNLQLDQNRLRLLEAENQTAPSWTSMMSNRPGSVGLSRTTRA